MKKEYILTFCISFLILSTIVVIALMILLPQRISVLENSVESYSTIKRADYSFKEINGLSFDNLVRQYNVTDEQMARFKYNNQYKPGNSDPFTVPNAAGSNQTNTGNTTNNNGTSTEDKITNSNDGVKNPASTGK